MGACPCSCGNGRLASLPCLAEAPSEAEGEVEGSKRTKAPHRVWVINSVSLRSRILLIGIVRFVEGHGFNRAATTLRTLSSSASVGQRYRTCQSHYCSHSEALVHRHIRIRSRP
jgi:hypothetical protein